MFRFMPQHGNYPRPYLVRSSTVFRLVDKFPCDMSHGESLRLVK